MYKYSYVYIQCSSVKNLVSPGLYPLSINIHIYVYTYIYTYVHVCIYINIHINVNIRICKYMCIIYWYRYFFINIHCSSVTNIYCSSVTNFYYKYPSAGLHMSFPNIWAPSHPTFHPPPPPLPIHMCDKTFAWKSRSSGLHVSDMCMHDFKRDTYICVYIYMYIYIYIHIYV